ncbi:MAG: DUF3558 family protein [Betaproteobacteria bacterium]|nr:DUF3558 family protein [Betaproteobacteria bacterium]
MRTIGMMIAASVAVGAMASANTQDGFDACEVFTQAEARKVLGAAAEPEPVNPKARKPKVVPTCTWWASKDGKPVSASATFRFAKTEADAQRAFEEERLKFQTKPMLIGGASAFWSARQGNVQLLKGRTWVVVAVGGPKPVERDADASKRLAEVIEKKL